MSQDAGSPQPVAAQRELASGRRLPRWGIAVSVLVGAVVFLPHIYFRLDARHPGGALFLMGAPDEELMAVRLREVVDGHYGLGQAYFHEGKDLHPLYPRLNEWVLGTLARVGGLDVGTLMTILDFLLPALGAFLLFRLGRTVSGDCAFGALFAAAVYLSSFPFPQAWAVLWGGWQADPWKFLLYYRTPHNQISLVLLAPILELAYVHVGKPEPPARAMILLGLLWGILLHVYVYFAGFAAAVLAVWWLAGARGRWKALPREFAYAAAGAALPLAWFVVHCAGAWAAGGRELLGERGYFLPGSGWNIPESIVVLTLIHLLLLRWDSPDGKFMVCVGIAALLLANLGLMLPGLNLENAEHAVFWLGFAGAWMAVSALRMILARHASAARAWPALCVALLVLLAANGVFEQSGRYRQVAPRTFRLADYLPALEWLDRNAPDDSVVLCAPAVAEVVPIYTRHDIYGGSQWQAFFLTTADELDRRFFDYHRLWGLDPDGFSRHTANQLAAYFKPLSGGTPVKLERAGKLGVYREEVTRRYRQFCESTSAAEVPRYRLDFVVVGPIERDLFPAWRSTTQALERIWEGRGVEIYRFRR